jgi:type I restriction enzyme S subunit
MNWPIVKLSEVTIVNPRLPKDIDECQQVSFVAMASASEEGFLLSEEHRILKETKKGFTYFDAADVLLAKITPCFENGKCLRPNQIANQIGFGSTEFHVLRAIPEKLDSTYLFYLVWSDRFRGLGEGSMSGAAGQKRVSTDFLRDFEIPLPPLKEQKRIAAILDKADAIRRKRQQAIKLADDFLRSVFLDMFGDPVTNPKGWEVRPLGSLITSGPTNGLYKPSTEYGDGTRILRIDGFYNGFLSIQSKLKRLRVDAVELERYLLKERSIVINRVNSREYLGKSAYITGLEEPTVFESNMMNFSVDERQLNPRYLVELLQTPFIKKQILTSAKDAVNQSSINQQDIKGLEVLAPPAKLQLKFEAIAIQKLHTGFAVDNSLICSKKLFLALSRNASSGEL